jgi:hypothetical protein
MNNLEKLKSLAENLPEGYKANAQALIARMEEVVEGIGDEPIRWKASQLRLVQGTTDRTTIPKGTAIGDFVLGETRVERPLKFIPLRIWEGRQYWSPDQNETKLICSSLDGKLGFTGVYCNQCPHSKFDEVARKSDCGKTQNMISITSDFSDIFTATFAKTNYKVGLDLKTAATKAGVALYRRVYALNSETNSKYKNVENYAFETLGDADKVPPAEVLEFLKELFDLTAADRKDNVDKFHVTTLARRAENPVLTGPATTSSEEGTVLLTDDSGGGESTVSDLAKNYQV